MKSPNLVCLFFLGLFTFSFAAQAEVQIQNAHFKSKKNELHVKGKLKNRRTHSVYILDALTNRQLGTARTRGGKKFHVDIPINGFNQVPCMIRVQTQQRTFFDGFAGESAIAIVRKAPKSCGFE